ncbi:hypothetical protein C0989_008715 [Termitomyces sp. Mn162]|nr:hypothetical protein C0989_008715 [Termitomyces sp. Mn162]
MGKRKKSSRKPAPARQKTLHLPVYSAITTSPSQLGSTGKKELRISLAGSVINDTKAKSTVSAYDISLARDGLKITDLTEPIDIYSEWIDAADAAQSAQAPRRPAASSSRPIPAPTSGEEDSDDE